MSAHGDIRRTPGHASAKLHFLRHLVEMTLVMMVGMVTSAAVFLSAIGLQVDEALRQYPVHFVLVQALGMTALMVVWMHRRGHAWRSCSEMAAAMIVPAVPLVCLRLLHVIGGPICGAYCALTIAAMILLMVYRRSDYGMGAAVAAPPRGASV